MSEADKAVHEAVQLLQEAEDFGALVESISSAQQEAMATAKEHRAFCLGILLRAAKDAHYKMIRDRL